MNIHEIVKLSEQR